MSSRPAAVPIAPASSGTPMESAVASSDIVFANGQAFNGRGYRVCGVANQRGTLCGRIGTCPFHSGQPRVAKRRRPEPVMEVKQEPATDEDARKELPECVRRMDTPPQKSRFKRSWTPPEHRLFLQSMKKHGKGKWKEIARDVRTRTANQCQSHAQKYFLRQAKSGSERKKKSIHDLTDTDDVEQKIEPTEIVEERPSAQAEPPDEANSKHAADPCTEATSINNAQKEDGHAKLSVENDPHSDAPGVEALATVAAAVQAAPVHSDAVSTGHSGRSESEGVTSQVSGATEGTGITEATATARAAADTDRDTTGATSVTGANTTEDTPNTSFAAAMAAATRIAPAHADGAKNLALMQMSNGLATVPIVLSSVNGLPYAQILGNASNALTLVNPALGNMTRTVPAPPPPPRIRVTIHKNGSLGGGMALMLPPTMEEFFQIAKKKLAFDGNFKRVFTRSGGEITSLDEMCHDDALWLSEGEEFTTPT